MTSITSPRPGPPAETVVGPVKLPLRIEGRDVPFELWFYTFGGQRWAAVSTGEVTDGVPVPLRIESACLFGHVFNSAKCDCGYQLDEAFRRIAERGRGMVIYGIDQDARGLGVEAHFRIYVLRQVNNLDTEGVYRELDAPVDARTYEPVATMLCHRGVTNVLLLSNNPARRALLRDHGFTVANEAIEAPLDAGNISTLMLEKEDLTYDWTFKTHADWLTSVQARALAGDGLIAGAVVDDNETVVAEHVGAAWGDTAARLELQLAGRPRPRVRVAYASDLPRADELAMYKALGADLLVLPFAEIPSWLRAAGAELGLAVQDWERKNRYTVARPQLTLVGRARGVDFYARGDALRAVFFGPDAVMRAAAAGRAARAAAIVVPAGFAAGASASGGPGGAWVEVSVAGVDDVRIGEGFTTECVDTATGRREFPLDVDLARVAKAHPRFADALAGDGSGR